MASPARPLPPTGFVEERIEDAIARIIGNAAARIRDPDLGPAVGAASLDRDRPFALRAAHRDLVDGVRRVDDEVQDHLIDPSRMHLTAGSSGSNDVTTSVT